MPPSPSTQSPSEDRGSRLVSRLVSWIDRLNEGVGSFIRWLVLAMVLVGAYNAVARYTARYFGVGLTSNALLDLQWTFFSLVFLLGAGYALKRDAHVRVDVLYSRLGRRARTWVDVTGTLLFLLPFCAVMLAVSFPAVRSSWAVRELSPDPGGLPRYPIKTVILFSFALLILQGVAELWRTLGAWRRPEAATARQASETDDRGPGEAR